MDQPISTRQLKLIYCKVCRLLALPDANAAGEARLYVTNLQQEEQYKLLEYVSQKYGEEEFGKIRLTVPEEVCEAFMLNKKI